VNRWWRPASSLALLAGCGGDGDVAIDGEWDVVLVVGAAVADAGADTSGFPGEGSTFEERWDLACDDGVCTLGRPEGGAALGDLDGLRIEPVDDREETWRGEAEGVRPVPGVEEPSPCAGTPTESWVVQIELTVEETALVGSVFRIPDALVAGDCYGLDLTLGLSGSRRS
jgi:hypothetical protein